MNRRRLKGLSAAGTVSPMQRFIAPTDKGDLIMKRLLVAAACLLSLIALPAFAQSSTTTIATHDDPDLGTILTDPDGNTLYIFANDTPGESVCYDQCATNWPPFIAEEPLSLPDGVPGELGLIERTDGTMQVTYNDQPLYFFIGDEQPGDTNGQNVGEIWFVVNPSAPGATPVASPAASPVA